MVSSSSSSSDTNKKVIHKPKWDPTFEPLVHHLIASNGVKIRPAVEVGKKAVEYCRATDLVKWVLKHEETLRNKFPNCFENPSISLTSKESESLIMDLSRLGFIYRAHYKPISNRPTEQSPQQLQPDSGKMNIDSSIPKWPKRLEMSREQRFDMNSFYIFRYEPKSHWPYIYLALIVAAVLAVCLFPAWPLALKLSTWYLSVFFLTFILGSVVIRLALFTFFWFFGVDFWFFPNLFDEELGVIDSFKPLFTWDKREDDWGMFAARIFLGILMIATGYQLSQTHSLLDVHRFAKQQFLDVLDWGHQKLAAPPAESSVPIAKFQTSPSSLDMDPLDGFRCMQPCGFESFDVLKEECLFDCSCMKEVMESHCFKKCSDAARKSLEDSKVGACSSKVIDDNLDDDFRDDDDDEL